MKAFNDYNETKSYNESNTLKKGAYPLQVMAVQMKRASNGNEYLDLLLDIRSIEYDGYFTRDYQRQMEKGATDPKWHCHFSLWIPLDNGTEQDGWTKRKFKTIIEAFEDSNDGFVWDWNEQNLKGKFICGYFNLRQYKGNDGNIHEIASLKTLMSTQQFASGKYKVPEDELMEESQPTTFVPVDGGNKEFVPY